MNPYFVHISRYRHTKFWAVWRGEELIAVTVYRKGAESVAGELRRLEDYETPRCVVAEEAYENPSQPSLV